MQACEGEDQQDQAETEKRLQGGTHREAVWRAMERFYPSPSNPRKGEARAECPGFLK